MQLNCTVLIVFSSLNRQTIQSAPRSRRRQNQDQQPWRYHSHFINQHINCHNHLLLQGHVLSTHLNTLVLYRLWWEGIGWRNICSKRSCDIIFSEQIMEYHLQTVDQLSCTDGIDQQQDGQGAIYLLMTSCQYVYNNNDFIMSCVFVCCIL